MASTSSWSYPRTSWRRCSRYKYQSVFTFHTLFLRKYHFLWFGNLHHISDETKGALIIEDDAESEGLPKWYTEMEEMIVKILRSVTTLCPWLIIAIHSILLISAVLDQSYSFGKVHDIIT